MSAKTLFTLSDIRAMSDRIAERNRNVDRSRPMPVDPAHAIAAKIMREVGVSREKMQQAYLAALKELSMK
jgi:hypothetical protein